MSYYFKLIVFKIFIFLGQVTECSLLSGTLIKTPKGLVPVEYIVKGDDIIGCIRERLLTPVSVIDISSELINEIIILTTLNGKIYAVPDQLFCIISDVYKEEWISAEEIKRGMLLFDSTFSV